jgi:hypothetical protein
MLEDRRFDPSAGAAIDLLSYCRGAERAPNILISSESFAVAFVKDGTRERFLSFLHAARGLNDDVYVVFTFRSFWRRMESAYFEDLKIGRQVQPLRWHVENNKRWLANFLRQMDQLLNVIGADRILALDVETETKDSISAVLSSIGLREDQLPRRRKHNLNVRLSLKKAAYLHLLQYDADGSFKNQTAADPFSIVRAIRDTPPLPNDTLDYRMFPAELANEIQEFARAALPSFLHEKLWKLTEPETTEFDVINLAEVQLTEEDDRIINAAILAHHDKTRQPQFMEQLPSKK